MSTSNEERRQRFLYRKNHEIAELGNFTRIVGEKTNIVGGDYKKRWNKYKKTSARHCNSNSL